MRRFIYDFTVEGRGDFPCDMLRYDECFPVDAASAMEIQSAVSERVRVKLRTMKVGGPTPARWESFRWKVVEQSEDYA